MVSITAIEIKKRNIKPLIEILVITLFFLKNVKHATIKSNAKQKKLNPNRKI
jgi:hypothetical protein